MWRPTKRPLRRGSGIAQRAAGSRDTPGCDSLQRLRAGLRRWAGVGTSRRASVGDAYLDCSPGRVHHDAALLACWGRQQGQTVELLNDMQRGQIVSNAKTYESVTNVCKDGGKYKNEVKRPLKVCR